MAAPPALPTQSVLEQLREIQAWGDSYAPRLPSPGSTAPDYCLGAAKFTLAKLVGLLPGRSHLNEFLGAATGGQSTGLKDNRTVEAWGRRFTKHAEADFNNTVLPIAVTWGNQGRYSAGDVEYVHKSDRAGGDRLLSAGVPIVVGVSLHGASLDHYIVLVTDKAGVTWAIDSWDSNTSASVVALKAGGTLVAGMKARLNSGTAGIPAPSVYIGWYRHKGTKAALPLKVVL